MTLQDWDREIAPHLQRIEALAESVSRNAQYVKLAVMELPRRPDWQTRSRAALDDAGARLFSAMKQIHDARELYDAKLIIEDAA